MPITPEVSSTENVGLDNPRSSLIRVMRDYATPVSLTEATKAVMEIPGFERYRKITGSEAEALSAASSDMLIRTQALAEISWVKSLSGMSDQEADELFSRPERTAYTTLFDDPKTLEEQMRYYLAFGSYFVKRYEEVQRSGNEGDIKSAAGDLRRFEEHSVSPLFIVFADQTTDDLWAIDSGQRKAGTVAGPNSKGKQIVDDVTKKLAQRFNINPQDLQSQIMAATAGGDFRLIRTFLHGYSGSDAVRHGLVEVFKRLTTDDRVLRQRLKTIWLTELYKEKIGLSLETAYRLNGFPDPSSIPDLINNYLTRTDITDEMLSQLKIEAPDTSQRIKNGEIVDFETGILTETNRNNGMADSFPSLEEIRIRNLELRKEWTQMFPPALIESLTAAIHLAERIGATRRAFNCKYDSGDRGSHHPVTDSLLNPFEDVDRFFRVQAHELTHAAHGFFLTFAEKKGLIQPGSADAVPHNLREILALMVEGQAMKHQQSKTVDGKPARPILPSKYHPDFKSAVILRAQGPYALAQLTARQIMRKLIKNGTSDLDDDSAREITKAVEESLQYSSQLGFPMEHSRFTPLSSLSDLAPYDGLVYITEEISEKSESPDQGPDLETITIPKAFEQRFGENWLWGEKRQQAIIILCDLFIETGLHPQGSSIDIQDLIVFILTRDPSEASARLQLAGIDHRFYLSSR